MTFAHPYVLLLLLLLPVLAWLKGKVGFQPAFLYSSVQLVRGITGITRSRAGFILLKLRWLALALFILALARPQLGEGETKITASGIDIVLAIDLSGSMNSEDFQLRGRRVNRLMIAKDVLQQFVAKRANDRIGLVAFATDAYIAAPLTLDHDFLLQNLDRLEIAAPGKDQTAIGSALANGHEAEVQSMKAMTQGGNVTESVLRSLAIPYCFLDTPETTAKRIEQAYTLAASSLQPVAILLTRDLMWEEN